jgi:phage tail sheath protein FI
MTVTTSYPGLYIQELPSSVHTITAAPTSITVFIGYTHPFKTTTFNEAVEIFDFTDYEKAFGGLFSHDAIDSSVAYAVRDFFLNGGAHAYVVGLQAKSGGNALTGATCTFGTFTLTAKETVDSTRSMQAIFANPTYDPKDTTKQTPTGGDLVITYNNSIVETYRKVSANPKDAKGNPDPNYILTRLQNSSLTTVAAGAATPASFPKPQADPFPFTATAVTGTTFAPSDFIDVFQTDGSLDKVQIFNIMAIPNVPDSSVLAEAAAFCERKRAFLIIDPPVSDDTPDKVIGDLSSFPQSTNAAIYYPYLVSPDPLNPTAPPPPRAPSGFVAGIYARTDNNRGVWKAPAGLEAVIKDTIGVVKGRELTDGAAGKLNNVGINGIRTFADSGTVVFGARTIVGKTGASPFEQWRYVPVRRMALFLEQTLLANLGWVVFEPNDEPLWIAIRTSIESFMLGLFHQGAFQGSTPSQAFQVKCDSSTTTQQDINNGIVNILVAFAPLKPAEFVVIQIAQLAGQASA